MGDAQVSEEESYTTQDAKSPVGLKEMPVFVEWIDVRFFLRGGDRRAPVTGRAPVRMVRSGECVFWMLWIVRGGSRVGPPF